MNTEQSLAMIAGGPGSGRHPEQEALHTLLKKQGWKQSKINFKTKATIWTPTGSNLSKYAVHTKKDGNWHITERTGIIPGFNRNNPAQLTHKTVASGHGDSELAKVFAPKKVDASISAGGPGSGPRASWNQEDVDKAHAQLVEQKLKFDHTARYTNMNVHVYKKRGSTFRKGIRETPESTTVETLKRATPAGRRDIKSAIEAGGPGSGRHKGLGTLSKEERLAEQRRIKQMERDDFAKQGKSARGKPILSDKAKLAKANVVTATKEYHDKAEEIEKLIAKKTGFTQSSNNKPFDVFGKGPSGKNHAVEVKALLLQKNDKITMKNDAIARKNKWAKQNKSSAHTVAVDLRGKKPVVYYRKGVGSFRLGNMTKVAGGLNGLRAMFK